MAGALDVTAIRIEREPLGSRTPDRLADRAAGQVTHSRAAPWYADVDWNTPSIRFYQKFGAKLRRQWILTRLTGAPLSRLARHRAANRS
jgi:hypothetical protein